jgi:plasmid stabilization system protein ParE
LKQIRWSSAAANDLEGCYEYLLVRHPSLLPATIQKLYDAALSLKTFPLRGRAGAAPDTRELVMAPLPYIIPYRVTSDLVIILRILHTSRQRLS